MVPQFEKNLLHLERGGDGFNEDGGTDGVVWDANVGLGEEEDVVPESRLEVVLHFGKVEVRTGATLDELFGIVEKVKSEIEDRAGDGSVVDRHTGLVQVPSSRTNR